MTTPPPNDQDGEIAALVSLMHGTQRRLFELTGDPASIAGPDDQTREKLRLSEERFRNMLIAATTGIAVSAPDGHFLQVNAAYCQMLGYTEQELLGCNFAAITHPEDLGQNLQLRDDVLAGRRDHFIMEKRYLRKTGESLWVRHSVSATRDAAGNIVTFLVVAEDIDERKLAELRLTRLNRLHTVQSKVSETILRARNRPDLYDAVCRIVVEHGGLRMVFIAELDAAAKFVRPVAAAGAGLDYLLAPTSIIPTDGGPLSQGTVGTAIRTGVYDVCNDIAGTPRIKPWRDLALAHGLRANASFPLKSDGAVIGVLVLYAAETDYFLADEIALMSAMADNLSFALDAQHREQQREQAETRSRQLSEIVASSYDAIIGQDLAGLVTSWNKGAERIFGQSAAAMTGTPFTRLITEDRRQAVETILARTCNGDVMENFEATARAKTGGLITVAITASPIRNGGGRVAGVSVVAHDITQAKKTASRFRRLVDSNVQGVLFWNINGGIIDANDAFLSLIGYTRADLETDTLTWIAITPPDYVRLDQRALGEIANTGVCTPYEKEFIRKDGSRVAVLIGSAAFQDNPDEGVCFVLDLTAAKRLEKQLRQAQKMESIGTLAGGVAHDFNNILAIIEIQTDFLINGGALSADQLESADDIRAAAARGAALTRQLLLFSSRQLFEPQDLDLTASIAETIKMLTRLLGPHINMQFRLPPAPMFIRADPGMIDQIMLNLIVNAADAMPDGGDLVIETSGMEFDEFAAALSADARVGAFVCLSVSDSGHGMSSEVMGQIFEPFFTTKDVGRGTGLGLATVYGIVQQHQGWINVYSEVGHGTTFRIYLPRLPGHPAQKPAAPAPPPVYEGHETILLVEDDAQLRASVQTALSRLGYRVLDAPNGATGLAVWQQHQRDIQLVITDLVMPDRLTGVALANRMTQDRPGLKVIYMSGYSAQVAGRDVPLQEGINFLTKPFQAQKLAKIVRTRLDS